jgi:hypothetical protein
MPIDPNHIEMPRCPAGLRRFIEQVRAGVRDNRNEFVLGMTKKGHYKQFLDEVEPLCAFAEAAYPSNYTVKPVLGNQGYDAIAFDDHGNEFEKIEFAKPHDGSKTASHSQQVINRGYSDVHVCDAAETLDDLLPFIEATCKSKSQKDYSGITLVFVLAALPPMPDIAANFGSQIARITGIVAAHTFNAQRVFLLAPGGVLLPVRS